MNLPELTALIGSVEKNDDNLSTIIASIKLPKKNDNIYAINMVIDLETKIIRFANPIPYNDELRYRYHYFGNNSAASAQCYLVREVDSLYYLLSSVWNDLFLALNQNDQGDSKLAQIIIEMNNNGLIRLGSKKGEGSIVLEKLSLFAMRNDIADLSVDKNKKIITIVTDKDKTALKFEQLIRLSLGDKDRNDNFLLIIPVVKLATGEEIVLSNHPDYLELVKKLNHLDEKLTITNDKVANKFCYVCHQMKPNVSSKYTLSFGRSGINKVFTTTTINSAKQINKINYDDNYSICNECYQNMRKGEKIINQRFSTSIARERAFIIPESILENFDYSLFGLIKDSVDFAFQSKEASDWIERINAEAFWMDTQYVLNIIFYRTDGNSVTVLETIADIPLLRFERLMKTLAANSAQMRSQVNRVSLSSIYRMIPVKKSKTDQTDIGRVLSFYKVLLTGGKITVETLFDYCAEALDKGLKQLFKNKVDNYQNLGILNCVNGKEDYYIKKLLMSYLILFRTCQQMGVLERPFSNIQIEEENSMEETINPTENINEAISRMERFAEQQGFNPKAKALYYLGALVYRVAIAQYQKEHKTKPILKKINFQGMTERDILRLYEDVVEKLRQYNRLTLFAENLMNKFHQYYGSLRGKDEFSEHANLFYLMAGYAYMVGNKAPDLSSKEKEAAEVQPLEEDDDEKQNEEEIN